MPNSKRWLCVILALAGLALSAPSVRAQAGAPAASPARITFIKEFPGSSPAYYSVSVARDGDASYATAPDDDRPVKFRLSGGLARELFDAVARLNELRGADLDVKKKIAFMGKKTLVYESGATRNQASFNYSDNTDAMALASLFEKISVTEQHLLNLERLVRFDRLGVYKELLHVEMSMNRRDLVEPEQLKPVLEKIVDDQRFMHVARERARMLLDRMAKGDYTPAVSFSAESKPKS